MKGRRVSVAFLAGLTFCLGAALRPEESAKPGPYLVGGERHGRSFFSRVDYPETRPLKPGEMDFRHYHTYDEVVSFLRRWEKDYPDLVTVYSVGRSFEGRDIWQMTITNKNTGPDTDKPAMFLEGNRHSGEVTAAESALYFAWHVLAGYGKDPALTHLVDTKALYVRVKNNPDGSELYLRTAQSNRSTVRPHDSDGDGLLDEDPAEDLDGDGFCRQMRRRVEAGKGEYILDPDDPSGRLLERAERGKGDYLVFSEGLDDDGDGKYNEDGVGGLDLHRNYPENWRPEPGRDLTGRGWTQNGAGAYPLSEPETRSVVVFLLEHPNVSVGQSMDTAVPMHLRPPSTSRDVEAMFPEDLALYRHFDAEGRKITGYPYAGDVYWEYANIGREERRGMRGAGEDEDEGPSGRPLFGHSPDFGYLYYGAIWYGDELWSGGRVKDYDGDGRVSDLEVLRWNDEALGGKGFKPWTKFNHPQLGEVEIGGYNPKFFRQNPPVEFLEDWARRQAMFNLLLAESLPQVKFVSAAAKPVKNRAGLWELACTVTNEGFLPTALRMAERVKIVRPDRVEVKLPAGATLEPGFKARVEIGRLTPGQKKEVRWRFKLAAPSRPTAQVADGKAAEAGKAEDATRQAEVTISSTRGGVDRKTILIYN